MIIIIVLTKWQSKKKHCTISWNSRGMQQLSKSDEHIALWPSDGTQVCTALSLDIKYVIQTVMPDTDKQQQQDDVMFKKVKSAYDVLSSEKERQQYDAHLRRLERKGKAIDLKGEGPPDGFAEVNSMLMNPQVSCMEEIFARIAELEGENSSYPTVDDGNLQKFYAEWGSFATSLKFEWIQREVPPYSAGRRLRRAIEQENDKARRTARKEYNQKVRDFVDFVKTRDERYRQHMILLSEERERKRLFLLEKERQEKDEKERRRVKHIQEQYKEEEGGEEDPTPCDLWFCPACEKYFKSQGSFRNHEKSKKHAKRVELLLESLLLEEQEIEFRHGDDGQELHAEEEEGKEGENHTTDRKQEGDEIEKPVEREQETQETEDETAANNKKEKKRRRRAFHKTKEGRRTGEASGDALCCSVCKSVFDSRNKLFRHIKEYGHAALRR